MKNGVISILLTLMGCFISSCQTNNVRHNEAEVSNNYYLKHSELRPVYEQAEQLEFLRSLIIWQEGEVIAEGYFQHFSKDSLDHMRSVTKSIISILIGIAIDQGLIKSIDDPIDRYLGKLIEGYGRGKKNITIRHLLTMTGGFKWNEDNVQEFNNWVTAHDQVSYLLRRELVNSPGSTFAYNSAGSHLLSVVLTEASGISTLEFASKYLFDVLGIQNIKWSKVSGGYYNGGAGLELKPRDLLKIGEMMMNKGAYRNQRIVSEKWIAESTKPHIEGKGGEDDYGYLWWIQQDKGRQLYSALGFGGQILILSPDDQIIIVVTSQWRNLEGRSNAYMKELSNTLRSAGKALEALN